MRKYNIILALLVLLFCGSSCNSKEDAKLPNTSVERIDEAIERYFKTLTASEFGWKLEYKTKEGVYYNFLFNFKEEDQVLMACDFEKELKESTWKISASQSILLSFDTYNYLHFLSDPEVSPEGKGKEGEFEFMLDATNDNIVKMTGRKYRANFELVKATKQDWDEIKEKEDVNSIISNPNRPKFWIVKNEEGASIGTLLLPQRGLSVFYYIDENGKFHRYNSSYRLATDGLDLEEPIHVNGVDVKKVNILNADEISLGDWKAEVSDFATTHVDAEKIFMQNNEAYIISDMSPVLESFYNKLIAKFKTVIALEYNNFWNSYASFGVISREPTGNARYVFLLDRNALAQQENPGSIYFTPNGYISRNGGSDKTRNEILGSEEFQTILQIMNLESKGLQLIPVTDKLFYAISNATPQVWFELMAL